MSPSVPAQFDELIHAPLRLRACALLAPVQSMAFAALRDELDVADSVLSKHLKALSEAGYVSVDRPTGQVGRPKAWVKITPTGRRALAGHLAALEELAAAARAASGPGLP